MKTIDEHRCVHGHMPTHPHTLPSHTHTDRHSHRKLVTRTDMTMAATPGLSLAPAGCCPWNSACDWIDAGGRRSDDWQRKRLMKGREGRQQEAKVPQLHIAGCWRPQTRGRVSSCHQASSARCASPGEADRALPVPGLSVVSLALTNEWPLR